MDTNNLEPPSSTYHGADSDSNAGLLAMASNNNALSQIDSNNPVAFLSLTLDKISEELFSVENNIKTINGILKQQNRGIEKEIMKIRDDYEDNDQMIFD